jgi:hypothetical protein
MSKWLLIALFSCLTASAQTVNEISTLQGNELQASNDIPAIKPLSAVIVMQCLISTGLFATMPDGEILLFNHDSKVNFAKLIDWSLSAKYHAVAIAKC